MTVADETATSGRGGQPAAAQLTVFRRSAAADVVVTVGQKVTGLKNNISNVNMANYTMDANTVTINAEYLAGLADGLKVFRILQEDGSEVIHNIQVGD